MGEAAELARAEAMAAKIQKIAAEPVRLFERQLRLMGWRWQFREIALTAMSEIAAAEAAKAGAEDRDADDRA